MTKFLLDENVPPAIGVFFRSTSFDVVHTKEVGMLGASDDQIMELARQEERTLITFDKHFADLVRYPPRMHCGVFRLASMFSSTGPFPRVSRLPSSFMALATWTLLLLRTISGSQLSALQIQQIAKPARVNVPVVSRGCLGPTRSQKSLAHYGIRVAN